MPRFADLFRKTITKSIGYIVERFLHDLDTMNHNPG